MKRGAPLKRYAKVKPINRRRAAKRRARDFGGPYRDFIVSLPCDACGAPAPSEPSHVKTRGAGGHAEAMLPHCARCHREFHAIGRDRFAARWCGTAESMLERASALHRRWQSIQAQEESE